MAIIDSLFHNYYVPPVVFAISKDPLDGYETRLCVDGKQRLTSIQKFFDGQVSSPRSPYHPKTKPHVPSPLPFPPIDRLYGPFFLYSEKLLLTNWPVVHRSLSENEKSVVVYHFDCHAGVARRNPNK
jgi:hypothetical protein